MLANHRLSSLAFAGAILGTSVLCEVASAGPLVDWLLNNRYGNTTNVTANYPMAVAPIAYAVGPYSPTQNAMALPTYPTAPYTTSYTPITQQTAGYVPATTTQTLGYVPTTQQTVGYLPIPQTTLGVLPIGSYQTTLNKVPTTYYRPVTSLDPNTGTTVTTLQPCTSYQQQVLRVPMLGSTSTPYYAAYGGYGTSLQQSGYGPSYGSTIATAPGQSTLSIPSTVNGLSAVNRIPVTGTVVNQMPIITSNSAYTPITVQSVPGVSYGTAPVTTYAPTTLPPVVQSAPTTYSNVPASTYPSGTTYLNSTLPTYSTGTTNPGISSPNTSYSNVPLQSQTSQYTPPSVSYPGATGKSIVQADGTIITPLGSSTSSAAPQSAYSNSQNYSGSNYAPQTYNNNGAIGTSVLPSADVLPQNGSYPVQQGSSNPALNGSQVPQNSTSNPAVSSDPASLVPPSLSPLSNNSMAPNNKTVVSADYSKMVAIDRPSQNNFTRNPVASSSVNSNAFVNDKAVTPSASFTDSTPAPALLKPRANENELQGVRPPEGYSPKPYWRSKQQSASPNALYNNQEKTARTELKVINPISTASDLNSGAQVQFVGGQVQASGDTSASRVQTAAVITQPSTSSSKSSKIELKRNPVTGLRLPASR